jgi:hypothetical protein
MKTTSRIPKVPNGSYFAMNRWFHRMYLAGLLYHPDEPAETIVKIDTGERTFTREECIELDRAVEVMFEHHGDAVYDCGLKYFYKALGITPDYTNV